MGARTFESTAPTHWEVAGLLDVPMVDGPFGASQLPFLPVNGLKTRFLEQLLSRLLYGADYRDARSGGLERTGGCDAAWKQVQEAYEQAKAKLTD